MARRTAPKSPDRAAIVAAICEQISKGDLAKDACKKAGITRATLHNWTSTDRALLDAYARAREEQAHALAEQAVEIANGEDPLTLAREDAIEEYAEAIAGESNAAQKVRALESNLIQRDKLRVDTLKWMTSKIAPRDYGERQFQEHSGGVRLNIEYVEADD